MCGDRGRRDRRRRAGVRGGAGLNITDLADLLVRAGAVRAMELDINTDWVNFSTYRPAIASGLASRAMAPSSAGHDRAPARYFEPWWARDFITMSSAVGG